MKIFSYRYLPLNIYVMYSCFVLVSLLLGPMVYKDLDYLILIPFLMVLIVLFVFGYMVGARGAYRQYSIFPEKRFGSYQRVRRFVGVLLFFGVVGSLAQWSTFFTSGGELNFGNIGENYVKGYKGVERGQARVDFFYVLNIFYQALTVLVLLFSLYYFRVMRAPAKYAFLFIIVTYLLVNVVASGKQKYLGDVVIFSFFGALINFAAKAERLKFRTVCIAVVVALFVFFLFLEVLRQRYLSAGIGLDNIHAKAHALISWDESSLVFNLIGSDYALALGVFLGYFTNGLYGLYLSLTLPFEWSYFIGNSYSLGRIAEIGLSADGSVLEHTYPYRVGIVYGWNFDKWHSMFAWLASDITFFGVLLLAPLFSFLYARLWLQAIKASNPFAGPLFIYFSLGLIFSYANNQIMHGLAGVIVLFVLLSGWMFSRNFPRRALHVGEKIVLMRGEMNKYWKIILIFAFIFLGKLSGFFKDILITFYHGISVVTDAYFLSNSVSSLLYMAVYSVIPIVLVPLYSRLLGERNISATNRELSSAISFFFILSVCIGAFVFGAGGSLLGMISASVDGQVMELSVSYLSIMSATYVFSTLVSFFNSIQAVNKIVIPSFIVPIVNNSFFCAGLFFFGAAVEFDKVLLLGVLAWIILLIVNFFISHKNFSFVGNAAFSCFSDGKFMFVFLPAVTAFYIEQVNAFVGIYFASGLGVGAISLLAYSNKLNLIFLSVFLVFLTASIFPRIAAASTRNGQAELFHYLAQWMRLVIICSIPAVIYMSFYAEEIVGLLFQRGNFGMDDVVKLASIFSVILIALPFCLLRDIMNRVFFSYGNTLTPVFVSLASLSINFSFSYVLSQQYGLEGLASSAVVSIVFNSLVMIFLVQRKINFGLFVLCLRLLVLGGICGVIAYLSLSWLNDLFFDYWWALSIPFALVYFMFIFIFMFHKKIHHIVSFLLRGRLA